MKACILLLFALVISSAQAQIQSGGKFVGEDTDSWLWGSCDIEIIAESPASPLTFVVQDNGFFEFSRYKVRVEGNSTNFWSDRKFIVRGSLSLTKNSDDTFEYLSGPSGYSGNSFNLEVFFDDQMQPIKYNLTHISLNKIENSISCANLKAL